MSFMNQSIIGLLLVGAACSAPAVEQSRELTAADETAIRTLIDAFTRNIVERGFVSNVELLTDDYIEMRADAIEGIEDARERWGNVSNTYTAATGQIRRLEGAGNLAYAWVEFTQKWVSDAGVPRVQTGNTLWILRRGQDGQWRFAGSGWQSVTANDTAG